MYHVSWFIITGSSIAFLREMSMRHLTYLFGCIRTQGKGFMLFMFRIPTITFNIEWFSKLNRLYMHDDIIISW